jgi:hypothetical protein
MMMGKYQLKIDSLEIQEESTKKIWNYCIFNKEDYNKKRKEEMKPDRSLKIIPREIAPKKFIFSLNESQKNGKEGVLFSTDNEGYLFSKERWNHLMNISSVKD